MSARWTNWAGNQRCAPAAVEHPATESELAHIVRDAAVRGERVKVVGAGHSFTGIALTDGRLVQLDEYRRVLAQDAAARHGDSAGRHPALAAQ